MIKLHFSKTDPLNKGDSETTTFGCRAYNSDICKYCYSEKCGLYNANHICQTPPTTWKKIYNELKIKD